MQRKVNTLLVQAAQALCAVLGAPPFMLRGPAPAVVLLPTHGRTSHDRATLYYQRYSRYLAATGGDQRF
jgi:hypothetical protein